MTWINGRHLNVEHVLEESLFCHSADDLLTAIVTAADGQGRYHGRPMLMRSLCWAQDDLTRDQVSLWLDELVHRGDVEIRTDGVAYGGSEVPIAYLLNRHRFDRYRERRPIPAALRRRVMERDEHTCQECGATDDLSIDHIVPSSRGGPETEENLRVLCRPCNSRKGARCSTSS